MLYTKSTKVSHEITWLRSKLSFIRLIRGLLETKESSQKLNNKLNYVKIRALRIIKFYQIFAKPSTRHADDISWPRNETHRQSAVLAGSKIQILVFLRSCSTGVEDLKSSWLCQNPKFRWTSWKVIIIHREQNWKWHKNGGRKFRMGTHGTRRRKYTCHTVNRFFKRKYKQ